MPARRTPKAGVKTRRKPRKKKIPVMTKAEAAAYRKSRPRKRTPKAGVRTRRRKK